MGLLSCPRSGKFYVGNSTIFHVHKVETFNWRARQYFRSTRWKSSTGELYDISCLRSEKVYLENSTIFHVREVEKFNWRARRYFMSTK